ncbi:MAG TPA: hypothetical protein VF490_06220, partial [Chryseosolibacter sp.]
MRTPIKCPKLLCLLTLICLALPLRAQHLPPLKKYLKKSVSWTSPTLGRSVPLNIYFQGDPKEDEEPQVIVYLQNKAWPRIGQEPDLS